MIGPSNAQLPSGSRYEILQVTTPGSTQLKYIDIPTNSEQMPKYAIGSWGYGVSMQGMSENNCIISFFYNLTAPYHAENICVVTSGNYSPHSYGSSWAYPNAIMNGTTLTIRPTYYNESASCGTFYNNANWEILLIYD